MLPVKHNGRLEVVVITAENAGKEVRPIKHPISVYEISYAKKNAIPSKMLMPNNGDSITIRGNDAPSEITIREMLSVVKDAAGNSYLQMAGEHALTANQQALVKAQEMETAGKDADEIWKATGWLKGKDARWRFEIPDNLDKIDLTELEKGQEGAERTLGEIYDSPALYAAYPWLKDVHVMKQNLSDEEIAGMVRTGKTRIYASGKKMIVMSAQYLSDCTERAKETLVHEIRHVIQSFSRKRGGDPATLSVVAMRCRSFPRKRG